MLRRLRSFLGNLPLINDIRMMPRILEALRGITKVETQRLYLEMELVSIERERFLREAMAQEKYRDPRRLAGYEAQVYSQNGEDGIVAEIFRRIGTTDKTFVEACCGNGTECNSAFLLAQGWCGTWIEGDPANAALIRANHASLLKEERITLLEMFITAENISEALRGAKVPNEFDFLSLDLDRNTYWIWEALSHLRPRVLAIEYNAVFPPWLDWKIPYSAQEWWDNTFNFGGSLKAYELLGRKLGYSLVGCDFAGVNAFFVRDDLLGDHFAGPYTAENHYEPYKKFLASSPGHARPMKIV